MLDEKTLDGIYKDIEDGGYLDDWVLNCARAMRDQAKTAIDGFKRTAQKPIERIPRIGEFAAMFAPWFSCPSCDALVERKPNKMLFCPQCGQPIDWE